MADLQFKMRCNRIVETEAGSRDVREIYLVTTNRQGLQMDEKVQNATFNGVFYDQIASAIKQNSTVTITVSVETEEQQGANPTPEGNQSQA